MDVDVDVGMDVEDLFMVGRATGPSSPIHLNPGLFNVI